MERRLKELLEGGGDNYILPFFWQHGEDETLLREGMRKIRESEIRAVCVESRPHPDFVGESWWRDMDVIMDEADRLDMRVWVLDDAHFPSGYANGKVEENSPYAKTFLDYYHIDAFGPASRSSFLIKVEDGETLEAVTAGIRDPKDPEKLSEVRELTALVRDGILYWDVPEGDWVLTVFKTTRKAKVRPGYINIIDRDAVRFFIDTVYEPHYAHYKEQFGRRFAGFFSDEPEIGNVVAHHLIGHSDAPLPWCEELESRLKELWGPAYGENLTALFCKMDGISPRARVEFMDEVTHLYDVNFCGQIGQWCRDRGVEYIGHVIEDNGCHAMMGLGTGHFFRALWGQDMSGIDVVLQQIRPGYEDRKFHHIGGKGLYDGRFFQFGLAKMGASLGHLDEKKHGRTMCEMYGAYGWSEGLKLMKWLTDHMLVRGVNHFVPHAFTMKDFPDPDCPPHFYARGNNPQYPYFRYLMQYMNRVSHLINGGIHVPGVGLFYNACAEWAGEYEPFEEAGMILSREQIDYEVLPEDVLKDCRCENGRLIAGREPLNALIFPYCEYLPQYLLDWCGDASAKGLEIIFLEKSPKVLETGETFDCAGSIVLSKEILAPYLRKTGAAELMCAPKAPDLRYYHYRQQDGEFYLFFNESANRAVETEVWLPLSGRNCCRYDAFDNCLYAAEHEDNRLKLRLSPYEAYILYVGDIDEGCVPAAEGWEEKAAFELQSPWTVTLKDYRKDRTGETLRLEKLEDITAPDRRPEFSGVMEYETVFDLPEGLNAEVQKVKLDFGEVYETMEVWLNGEDLGVRIAPPYCVTGGTVLKERGNVLKVRVVNTLVHNQRDHLSMTMPVEPSGLLGPVKVSLLD